MSRQAFADIHCHPLIKYVHENRANVWKSLGMPNKLAHRIGLVRFTSSDFRRMAKAGVQVVVATMTPPEQKTVFSRFKGTGLEKKVVKAFSLITRIPAKEIERFQAANYDHWEQLLREYKYLLDKQHTSRKIMFGLFSRKTCRYKVVKNYDEIEEVLKQNKDDKRQHTIAVLPAIESMHGVGTGHCSLNGKSNDANEATILKRVDAIKGIGSAEFPAWVTPPVWVTMAHAFDNGLCGQAQSLTRGLMLLFDHAEPYGAQGGKRYKEGLNAGLTEIGKKVIARCLNLDAESKSRTDPGRRVLIDIKHMSTLARKEYYEMIDTHNTANPNDLIPAFMSHAAVNGKPSFNENGFDPDDTDEEHLHSSGFSPWSINLYDDEIIRIHRTHGLMGLMFYEPGIAGGQKLNGKKKWGAREWTRVLVDHIEHIVKTVFNSSASDKMKVWDTICIGSDFDGILNPSDYFDSSAKFPKYYKELKRQLGLKRFDAYLGSYKPKELAEKICFGNVVEFLKRHY